MRRSNQTQLGGQFNDRRLELRPGVYVTGIPPVDIADSIAVSALTLSRCEPNYVSDWHQAPRRQFVFILQGGLDEGDHGFLPSVDHRNSPPLGVSG
jgi:hypothetical protein